MSDPTSSANPPVTVPCSVCGNEIQQLPEHLYQFRNQTGNSVLFVQKTDAVPPEHPNQKAKFVPAPICLSCVLKIVGQFVANGQQAACKIVAEEKQAEGTPEAN